MRLVPYAFPLALLFTGACKDVDAPEHEQEQEVITTVELTFVSQSGGGTITANWADPENDGSPVIDDIVLLDAEDYDLSVAFLNELEDPPEDITLEVADESDEHQLFFTGSGVQGPATGPNGSAVVEHAYSDSDADGLPVGLHNTITTLATGTGEFIVTLRHMPLEDGSPVKVAGLASDVASSGFGAIGGDNDVQVAFAIEVQ